MSRSALDSHNLVGMAPKAWRSLQHYDRRVLEGGEPLLVVRKALEIRVEDFLTRVDGLCVNFNEIWSTIKLNFLTLAYGISHDFLINATCRSVSVFGSGIAISSPRRKAMML